MRRGSVRGHATNVLQDNTRGYSRVLCIIHQTPPFCSPAKLIHHGTGATTPRTCTFGWAESAVNLLRLTVDGLGRVVPALPVCQSASLPVCQSCSPAALVHKNNRTGGGALSWPRVEPLPDLQPDPRPPLDPLSAYEVHCESTYPPQPGAWAGLARHHEPVANWHDSSALRDNARQQQRWDS
ncbi:hypothetical protein DHEL01_v205720 [Diaporthe helianthi]|uniref:Uncharacterized protein n=1 Tax=Diaporthe helianthi TaxID=158607 RepID=A0A2P5I068_DIAHE|nr:hypothetical protein DHEL01_v205720 [Diaporthe helianthi]